MLTCYYGRRGQGKTYAMTRDVVNALNHGKIVYANYRIFWKGYDESQVPFWRFLNKIHLKKNFKKYPASNLRRFESTRKLPEISHNSILALDEGYLYFDSYVGTKMKLGIRKWILFSRHMDIDIWYTAQRPMSIQTTLRSMTEIFLKSQAIKFPFMPVLFALREFDLGSDENVNEDEQLGRTKWYFGSKWFYNFYNTKGDIFMSDSDYREIATSFDVTLEELKKHFNAEEYLPKKVIPTLKIPQKPKTMLNWDMENRLKNEGVQWSIKQLAEEKKFR